MCDERSTHCDSKWKFDSKEEEERTRLIRCKNCRAESHLSCMLVHGHITEENNEASKDAKPATIISSESSDHSKDSNE